LPFCGLEISAKIDSFQSIDSQSPIGEQLKVRRKRLNLRQSELAKLIGVSEDCITNWETGKNKPYITYYPKLIKFLGYNPFQVEVENLGGQIRKYRVENGLSQQDLAKLLNVNESTVFHWENGGHKPLPSKLKLLEKIIQQRELFR